MATKNRKRAEQIVERDGSDCWLCGEPMDFKAEANSDGAWSVEHLLSKDTEGRDRLENLVLCHPPCNKRLRNLTLTEKVQLRDEVRRRRWAAKVADMLAAA